MTHHGEQKLDQKFLVKRRDPVMGVPMVRQRLQHHRYSEAFSYSLGISLGRVWNTGTHPLQASLMLKIALFENWIGLPVFAQKLDMNSDPQMEQF